MKSLYLIDLEFSNITKIYAKTEFINCQPPYMNYNMKMNKYD